MRLSKLDFREVVETFIFCLDEGKINTLEDATAMLGKKFPIGNIYRDEIVFGNGKLGQDSDTLKVGYRRPCLADPIIEGRFGLRSRSLISFVNYGLDVVGYEHFSADKFGNRGHIKNIHDADFESFRMELQSLRTLFKD